MHLNASQEDNLEPNNGFGGARIALLVDFDNVVLGLEDPGFDIELVVNALRERGTIVLGRVYGDWYRHNRHRRKLMEQGLELVETPAFGPVIKNSADIRIALDGFEIGLTQSHIDTFAIVSGDSDFLPLIKKLQSLGRRVLVICGNRFTSDMLRRNCNEFISYENLLAQSVGATEDATTLEGAFSLLHRAMAALRERGSEIRGSGVKQMMLQLNPVFSERTFGCTQFRQFLQKATNAGVVKLGARDKFSGEFAVLLPDEDEAPVAQKVERRNENRARREDKISQIAARIESVPAEDAQQSAILELDAASEVAHSDEFAPAFESDYSVDGDDEGGAVFADDAFGFDPETMAQARTESVQEIAQNVIARSELIARGLRPTKRVFSGRGGRPILEVEPLSPDELAEDEAPVEAEAELETFVAEEAPLAVEAEATPATDTRRLRSRRRRRSASGQITVVSDEAAPAETAGAEAPTLDAPRPEDDDSPTSDEMKAALEVPVETAIEFSHEPINIEEETSVDAAEAIEAPIEAVTEIQSALDALGEPAESPASNSAESPAIDESKGIAVEAIAPALPEGNDQIETADPMGVPAVAKRRRSPRSRTKKADAATEAPAEVAPVSEPVAEVAEAPARIEAEVAAEATTQTEEAAPAKARRRRPSRSKKADAAPAESSE